MPTIIIGYTNLGYSIILAKARIIQDDKLELLAKNEIVINNVIFVKLGHPILCSITRK